MAVNQGLVRISGRSREELLGTTGAIISYPDDIDIGKLEMERLVAGELNSYQVERRYLRKDALPYWVRQTISAVRNPDGQLMYLVVMVEDIDQQKKSQQGLLESGRTLVPGHVREFGHRGGHPGCQQPDLALQTPLPGLCWMMLGGSESHGYLWIYR